MESARHNARLIERFVFSNKKNNNNIKKKKKRNVLGDGRGTLTTPPLRMRRRGRRQCRRVSQQNVSRVTDVELFT